MTIDDKLKQILDAEVNNPIIHGEGVNPKDYFGIDNEDIIAQIKQAFADEGWVQTLKLNNRTIVVNGKDNIGWIVYYPNEVMTGKEWYGRFNHEVEVVTKNLPDIIKFARETNVGKEGLMAIIGSDLDKAAKKASGLE